MKDKPIIDKHALALTALGLVTIVPLPACAAGFDTPPYVTAVIVLSLILILVVPAMGVGFALGGFLGLKASIAVLVVLTLIPPVWIWMSYDIDRAVVAARILFVLLLMFSPLIGLGWWIGRRDAKRQAARSQAAYENGN